MAAVSLFDKGDGRACENFMSGTMSGNEVNAFDYWYRTTTCNGNSSSTQYLRFSCALVALDWAHPAASAASGAGGACRGGETRAAHRA